MKVGSLGFAPSASAVHAAIALLERSTATCGSDASSVRRDLRGCGPLAGARPERGEDPRRRHRPPRSIPRARCRAHRPPRVARTPDRATERVCGAANAPPFGRKAACTLSSPVALCRVHTTAALSSIATCGSKLLAPGLAVETACAGRTLLPPAGRRLPPAEVALVARPHDQRVVALVEHDLRPVGVSAVRRDQAQRREVAARRAERGVHPARARAAFGPHGQSVAAPSVAIRGCDAWTPSGEIVTDSPNSARAGLPAAARSRRQQSRTDDSPRESIPSTDCTPLRGRT